jgi:hypothetical protein
VGEGFAACAATFALKVQGVPVLIERSPSQLESRSPPLVLDDAAVQLIGNQFGLEVFRGGHQLRRRLVKWGGETSSILQPALAIQGNVLFDRVKHVLQHIVGPDATRGAHAEWSLFSSNTDVPALRTELNCGRRVTVSCGIKISAHDDSSTSWVETSDSAWVYLFPISDGRGVFQATVPYVLSADVDDLIVQIIRNCSPQLKKLVAGIETPAVVYQSAPTFFRPLADPQWLSIGAAAVRFDPLCGDGTAQSLRTGALAAATCILATDQGAPGQAIEHYERRVGRSFAAHLRACSTFYHSGNFGPIWKQELLAIDAAAEATADTNPAPLKFALRNGMLVNSDQTSNTAAQEETS